MTARYHCRACQAAGPCDRHCAACAGRVLDGTIETYTVVRWDPNARDNELHVVFCGPCWDKVAANATA